MVGLFFCLSENARMKTKRRMMHEQGKTIVKENRCHYNGSGYRPHNSGVQQWK